MKKLLFVILILSFSISVTCAQDDSQTARDREYYCKALKQYVSNLNHHNIGVVQSTIINLMKLRMECPDISYQATIDSLNFLVTNGRTSNIRFLALLGARYLENPYDPDLFTDIRVENDEQLITMLLHRLY